MNAIAKITMNGIDGVISPQEYHKIYSFFSSIGVSHPMMNEILPALALVRFGAWSMKGCKARSLIYKMWGNYTKRNRKNLSLCREL